MQEPKETIMETVLRQTDMEILSKANFLPDLSAYINNLIVTRFDELISLLYRLDISEPKLKLLLQQHESEDAADIIAGMILERQAEKIKSRGLFRSPGDIPEAEKW